MKVAVSGWSLHRQFQAGRLKLLDFPVKIREEFEIGGIELNSPFFDSLEDDYLKRLKERARENEMEVINIAVDNEGDLASLDEETRRQAVENHKKWIYIAKKVGSPSFRANAGGYGGVSEDVIKACIKSFSELCQEAEVEGISVLIENHGGISGDPDVIVRIMQEVGKGIGTCPDFGNFPDDIRYEGLEKMSKYARVVHAKFYEFDENGEDPRIDASRCVGILRKAGFDEWLSVEFEGKGDEEEGISKSIKLCRKYL